MTMMEQIDATSLTERFQLQALGATPVDSELLRQVVADAGALGSLRFDFGEYDEAQIVEWF